MRLPPTVRWEVSSVPGRQYITFLGHEEGFDISRVFDTIPRDQLTDIVQYPSQLELKLSCDCETKFFVEQQQFLVVDIVDGAPLPENDSTSESLFVSRNPQSNFMFGELLWSNNENVSLKNNAATARQDASESGEETGHSSVSSLEAEIIDSTRERLLQGVANAASRGLVRPVFSEPGVLKNEISSHSTVEIYDSSEQPIPESQSEIGNLRITNSRDIPDGDDAFDLMTSGAVCMSPDTVQIQNWGNSEQFHLQLSPLREALFSEVDRLDEKKAVELARLYIYFGLGAEAKQVLSLSETLTASNPELMDLADIVDLGFARNPRSVHRFADCDSDLALWAVLAGRTIAEGQVINEDAALTALAKLPSHLRDFIAPALSKRFTELGKTEAASIALRRVDLGRVSSAPDANLAKAKIEQRVGNIKAADKILSELSESNDQESPEALVAYIENRLADMTPVPAEVSLLIESYAFELKESPIGSQLFRAHVIASALSGQFAKALEALDEIDHQASPSLEAELQSKIFSVLSINSSDETFLEIFFTYFPETSRELDVITALSTAQRMKNLGFNLISQDILEDIPNSKRNTETDILEAEVNLDLGQPKNALEVLTFVTEKKADELRARAYLALGENDRAMESFQAAGMTEPARRAAWLADDWINLTSQSSDLFGDVRNLAEDAVESIATENGMIAATEITLQESASARTIVADLLEKVVVTP